MENRERYSEMTSSVRVGRCAMSTVCFLSAGVRHMTPRSTTTRPGLGLPGQASLGGASVGSPPRRHRLRGSDPATLRRAATVVRLRGDVLDRTDLEACRLERTDRGLATRARALDEDVDLLHAVLLRTTRGGLSGELGGERRRLARDRKSTRLN